MPDSILLPDCCLTALAKNGKDLLDTATLLEFLKSWNSVERYCDEILSCLQKNSSRVYFQAESDRSEGMPSDAERKAMMQAARLSKKLKGMDDPLVAKASRIDALRDQWRVESGVADDATKARVKKAADAKAKAAKAPMKAGATKDDSLNVRRLALTNSQQNKIGTYTATLPATTNSSTANPVMTESPGAADIRGKKQASGDKKKAVAAHLSSSKATAPAPRMELNRNSTKRTVRVTAKAVANTPTKQMHMVRPGTE
ncbi:hypothetical protein MMC07_009833 [Pseudocyphellaria aurata]|nr:hypothetical protein [Pseudocyphellaria aurata]